MLSVFIRRKRGVITVMLSIVLIATLSLNSTFIEIARFRSLERLYKEIEENAAFSVLSQYDRELWENFGLLAMSEETGKDDFMEYLQANMNLLLTDTFRVDRYLRVADEDVNFEQIYDLAQEDVLKMQINEFCAYRAPAEALNSIFNVDAMIEEKIEELVNKLDESVQLFEKFETLTEKAEPLLDAFSDLADFVESFNSLKEIYEEYQNSVDSFNQAVQARDDYRDSLDAGLEGYTTEGYLSACADVLSSAGEVKNAITSLKSALEEFYEHYKAFQDSFQEMKDAGIKSTIDEPTAVSDAAAQQNVNAMMEDLGTDYQEAEDACTEIEQKMNDYDDSDVSASAQALDGLALQLEGDTSGENLGEIDAVELVKWSSVENAAELAETTIAESEEGTEESKASLSVLKDILSAMKSIADIDSFTFGNTITEGWEELPSQTGLTNTVNPYAADEALVEAQKNDAALIARYTDFNMNTLNLDDGQEEYEELSSAMDAAQDSGQAFREQCDNLKIGDLKETIEALRGILTALKTFLVNVVNLIQTFVSVIAGGFLRVVLYQKFNPAIYTSGMFSNWVTDVDSDERLNGSSFTDYGDSNSVFARANAEYVLGGSNSEIVNEASAFIKMLMVRLLCNIPALLSDSALREIVSTLCGIPVIGWIAAIIVVVVLIFCEALLDMVFLLKGNAVDIIKMDGYLSLDGSGIDELKEQIADLLNNGTGGGGGYVDSLTQWDYGEHLLFLLLFFTSGEKMYTRCADLIQMQMRQSQDGFLLSQRNTYLRIESEVTYTPLLPMPSVPGPNSRKLKIKNIHYSGY